MKEKPKMYQNHINKIFHNNKQIYNSLDYLNQKNDIRDIRKKINDIITANSFIYSKLVNIKVGNKIIMRKIIGIDHDNLVTIDNEYIPIESIQDIYV